MSPPLQGLPLDIKALSGILGSVSIACWVVVFSPQIIENFRRHSAEGLSVVFIVVWLLGDVFNILGAVLQGVLPTMLILAVYYTLADLVLLAQCFYYQGFTLKDQVQKSKPVEQARASEHAPLLPQPMPTPTLTVTPADADRRGSFGSLRDRIMAVDGTHLSPAMPMHENVIIDPVPQTPGQGILFNVLAVFLVILAGVVGWWLGNHNEPDAGKPKYDHVEFNYWGQIFGYICAVLYLGSRIPQLLLNYRRKSTEGISMLFFLFACIGNLTYVLSIMAYEPVCERRKHCRPGETMQLYGRYIAVNLSWLIGSAGTLILDAAVFVQYFMYKDYDHSDLSGEEEIESADVSEERVIRGRRRVRGRAREVEYEGGA